MNLPDLHITANQLLLDIPDWRVGQTYMNCLRLHQPHLYQIVTNTPECDPTYNDRKLPMFFWLLEQELKKTES